MFRSRNLAVSKQRPGFASRPAKYAPSAPATGFESGEPRRFGFGAGLLSSAVTLAEPPCSNLVFGGHDFYLWHYALEFCLRLAYAIHQPAGLCPQTETRTIHYRDVDGNHRGGGVSSVA